MIVEPPENGQIHFMKLVIWGFSEKNGCFYTILAKSVPLPLHLENNRLYFNHQQLVLKTDAEEIKQKKGSKRVREGVSRMITVLQMDFQGRRELEVAKTGLSRYRKKNVIAFAKWAS